MYGKTGLQPTVNFMKTFQSYMMSWWLHLSFICSLLAEEKFLLHWLHPFLITSSLFIQNSLFPPFSPALIFLSFCQLHVSVGHWFQIQKSSNTTQYFGGGNKSFTGLVKGTMMSISVFQCAIMTFHIKFPTVIPSRPKLYSISDTKQHSPRSD